MNLNLISIKSPFFYKLLSVFASLSIWFSFLFLNLSCQKAVVQKKESLKAKNGLQSSKNSDKPYIGVVFSAIDYEKEYGLHVDSVLPKSPAAEAGVVSGDILIAIDDVNVSLFPKELAVDKIRTQIQSNPPLKPINLILKRGEKTIQLSVIPRILIIGAGNKTLKADNDLHLEWEAKPPFIEEEAIAKQFIKQFDFEMDYQDLRNRLARMTVSGDEFRINEIAYLQRHPLRMKMIAEDILGRVKPVKDSMDTANNFLKESDHLLKGIKLGTTFDLKLPALKTGISVKEHVTQLVELLAEANSVWSATFAQILPSDLELLFKRIDFLAAKFEDLEYLDNDSNRERKLENLRLLELASKIDIASLIRSSLSLNRISHKAYLSGLKRDLQHENLDLTKVEILNEKTPFGEIIIGGLDNNRYAKFDTREIAILIDLGGNDFYANRVATSTEKVHASIFVDVAGDDVYESNVDYSQGSGYLGTGILIDLEGNDSYIGKRFCQGASLLGIGLLIDGHGHDTYRANSYSQGCAFLGVAALIEQAGDDRYESQLLSQGVGIASGIAMLSDGAGNDFYYAKGGLPSGYGTPGTFSGWSQGVGLGIRNHASGGIGILYESDGNNKMESGDFCQGGGYYFGWGILRSGKGDDTYIGSRYAQGFSAHYALGTFLETGGDDRYETRDAVAAGLAWDLSITWFEDKGGNDTYPAQGFSMGASAHNSITIFIDSGGKNKKIGNIKQAIGQTNDYHGGTSFSLIMNRGSKIKSIEYRDEHTIILN